MFNNYITEHELQVKKNKLKAVKRELIKPIKAEYFREEVRKILYNQFGRKNLYEEGLVVKTTLNTFLQEIADKYIPGFGEVFRTLSVKTVGTSSIQSRACAVLAKGKYIFALPGSSGGVKDAWDKILVHQLDINHKPCNFVELFPRLKEK